MKIIKEKILRNQPLLVLVLGLLVSSCYTSKNVTYLQNSRQQYKIPTQAVEYRVQPTDVLDVKVQSRDPEQAVYFNVASATNRNFQANPAALFVTGSTVNSQGAINLAIIGEVTVAGLTIEEIRDKIQQEIDEYLVNALITVKMTSFKVSVLGDVKNPGTNFIYNPRMTIFEALSAAGDMNISGRRKNVRLIRQVGDEALVVQLDLRDPAIIQSPYYFLHPNDVIYVEPSKRNLFRNNTAVFTLLLSTLTTGILVFDYIDSN